MKNETSPAPSRRQFLGRLGAAGAGAVAATTVGGVAPATAKDADQKGTGLPPAQPVDGRFFGRMFPKLPPFAQNTVAVRAALLEIGRPGGVLDARDDLAAGPIQLITNPALNLVNQNNPFNTAGSTFVGQFIDHDLTFDQTSRLGVSTRPELSPNSRTPAFDLDTVFGGGPAVRPDLYVGGVGPKLKVENVNGPGSPEDLAREADGRAIIGEPRNQENLILTGLHLAFIGFYNRQVGTVSLPDATLTYLEARRRTAWHYQWLVVNQFLPEFVGADMAASVLTERPKAFDGAFIPVEFSGAVYRMGHSMVRPSYRANFTGNPGGTQFFGLIFDPNLGNEFGDRDDLLGGFRAPRRYVGWETFFDFGGASTALLRPNKLVDTKLSTPLFQLPLPTIAGNTGPGDVQSLPQRTLLRHLTWELPSGQKIAKELGVDRLSAGDLRDFKDIHAPFGENTPLFLYILREAELMASGHHLGPVGGRVVGEVFVGLLR
ncbi:MAG: hypothetical protein JWN29_2920, partial [Acidimicrobiales bacterium]|nr:hypothetical protein [Acidimicrobiales bacterium]